MNKLITTLIVVLTAANMNAQQITELPKLVVGISVNQLRSDYLEFLYNAFGEKGFKRLIQNGYLYDDVDFAMEYTDRASTMATVYTHLIFTLWHTSFKTRNTKFAIITTGNPEWFYSIFSIYFRSTSSKYSIIVN